MAATPNGQKCPKGCSNDPAIDDCAASLVVRCPFGIYGAEPESGRFQPCGHLERERCSTGCGSCLECSGCFCGENY